MRKNNGAIQLITIIAIILILIVILFGILIYQILNNKSNVKEQNISLLENESDKQNKFIDSIMLIDGHILAFNQDHKMGVLDKNGDIIIRCEYNEISPLEEGFAVGKNQNYALMDENGTLISDFVYDKIYGFDINGYITVEKDKKYALLDKKGNIIFDYSDNFLLSISNNIILSNYMGWNKYFEIIDMQGNTIISDIEKPSARSCKEGLYAIKRNGKWGYIDEYGNIKIDYLFDEVNDFSDGLAVVEKYDNERFVNDKYGFIDKQGNIVIDFIYEYAQDFSEGRAWVKKNGKYGCIDKKGNVIVDFLYDSPDFYGFRFEKSIIEKDKKKGIVDLNGNVILNTVFDYIDIFSNDSIAVKKGEKWGIMNGEMKPLFKTAFEKVYFISNDIIAVKENGKWGIINRNEDVIIEFLYDDIETDILMQLVKGTDKEMTVFYNDNKIILIDNKGNILFEKNRI